MVSPSQKQCDKLHKASYKNSTAFSLNEPSTIFYLISKI